MNESLIPDEAARLVRGAVREIRQNADGSFRNLPFHLRSRAVKALAESFMEDAITTVIREDELEEDVSRAKEEYRKLVLRAFAREFGVDF